MNGKLKFGSAFLVVLAAGVLLGFMVSDSTRVTMVSVGAESKHQDMVNVQVTRNGIVIYDYTTHNLVTTSGSTWVETFLETGTTGATNKTDDVAVGNNTGTPTISETKLTVEATTCNLTRQSCTATHINATAYSVLYQRVASGTIKVNATSLHYNPTSNTSGNVVAIASITQASLISGDTLKVTWWINVPTG
jgi:hypothetical protein